MKKYILLIILTVVAGALPLFLQYGGYLMRTDYATQEIPFIMETKRMLSSGAPWWSWNTYYGDNFWGSYGFYTLTSPFVWLLCLLPYGWIVKGCFVALVLKYICAFLTSRLFLRKMDVSGETASIGGLLYAFSSFTISNSFYFHFFEPLIVFPLLLVAVERFLRRERLGCTALLLAAFLTAFINYYFSVCSFIAAAIYVFCRLLFSEMRREWRRVPLGLLLVLMGIAMDAVVLLPTAMQLAGGPRTNGHIMSGLDHSAFHFFVERIRVLVMPQILEEPTPLFKGTAWNSQSVCLPLFGMFAALLYCWRNKKDWIVALLVLSLLILLTPLNTGFSGFTNPNYTRWAYALCLFLALASCRWLDGNPAIPAKQVGLYALCVTVIFSGALLYGRVHNPNNVPFIQLSAYAIVALVNLALLWLWARKKSTSVLAVCICVCVAAQMAAFHALHSEVYFETNESKDIAHHFGGSRDDMAGLIKPYLVDNRPKRRDGNMEYRTANLCRYSNMVLLAGRPDVQGFNSVQNNAVRRLMFVTDTLNFVANRAVPRINVRSFYALMSVKEIIIYSGPQANFDDIKNSLNLTEKSHGAGYTLYSNADYLPMGFTYDSYIGEAMIDTLNARKPKPDVPLQMLANLAVPREEEAFFAKHLRRGKLLEDAATGELARASRKKDSDALASTGSGDTLDSLVSARRKCVASSFIGTTTGFTSTITLPREDIVFYSVPADKGFTAYIDGRETDIHSCNLGLSAVLVPRGTHAVEFRFLPRGLKAGASVSLAILLLALGLFLWERKRIYK